MKHQAGYRRFAWEDASGNRPVWTDVWFPSTSGSEERSIDFGLGRGMAIPGAGVAAHGSPFPLIVMSPGAFGSAPNYCWLAEHLARNGFVVFGVSHYRESQLYGANTVDPASVMRLWDRPGDCTFALTQLLASEDFRERVDGTRIGALGHSSGGATVLALGGAMFDSSALAAYCKSEAARADRGCQYVSQANSSGGTEPPGRVSHRDPRVAAIVALDPAAGPGHDAASLSCVDVPVLVVGSTDNDFLPFEHHAGRYARLLPNARVVKLQQGEGHFVYLNSCRSDLAANGIRLCVDREGVDRQLVHERLAPQILDFFSAALPRSS